MVVRLTTSRIKRVLLLSVHLLRYPSSILSAFRSYPSRRTNIKALKASRVKQQAPVPAKPRFFDTSIDINPELIKTHACERLIGYQFKEPLLLWEALQAMGTAYDMPQMPRYDDGNMRLAIVGDRVLDLLLALKWYPTWRARGTHGLGSQTTKDTDFLHVS